MEEIKAWVKAHPYWAAGLGVGVLLLIYLWWRSGSSASSSTASPMDAYYNAATANAAAGDQLAAIQAQNTAAVQAAQIQQQAQQESDQAQENINASNNATQLQELQAEIPVQEQGNSLSAQVEQASIAAQQKETLSTNMVTNYASYLEAAVARPGELANGLLPAVPGANAENFVGVQANPQEVANLIKTVGPKVARKYYGIQGA